MNINQMYLPCNLGDNYLASHGSVCESRPSERIHVLVMWKPRNQSGLGLGLVCYMLVFHTSEGLRRPSFASVSLLGAHGGLI